MSEINALAANAYANGITPIDWAVKLTEFELDARADILASRAQDPKAYPGYGLSLDDGAVARRIVGALLDAGWTPPTVGEAS